MTVLTYLTSAALFGMKTKAQRRGFCGLEMRLYMRDLKGGRGTNNELMEMYC